MPLIPLIRSLPSDRGAMHSSRPLPDAPAPVLDHLRRPTLDTTGVQQALLRVNDAQQMPLMNPRAAAAPYEALVDLGREIARTGSAVGTLMAEEQKATNCRLINEGRTKLEDLETAFEAVRAEHAEAPETWLTLAQEKSAAAVKPLLEAKGLNRAGREQMAAETAAWQKRFLLNVQTMAAKAIFGRTRESFVQRAGRHYERGDRAQGHATLAAGMAGGYLALLDVEAHQAEGALRATQAQVAQLHAQARPLLELGNVEGAAAIWREAPAPGDFTDKGFEKVRHRAIGDLHHEHELKEALREMSRLAAVDPAQGLAVLTDPRQFPKLPPEVRQELRVQMRAAREEAALAAVDAAGQALARLRPEQVAKATAETLGVDLTQTGPWHREMIGRRVAAWRGELDLEREGVLLYAQAGAWEPSGDETVDAMSLARLETHASLLPAPDRARVLARLQEAQEGTGSVPITGRALAEAYDLIFHQAALGPVTLPVLKEGKPLMRDPREEPAAWIEHDPRTPSDYLSGWALPSKARKYLYENGGNPVPVTETDPVAWAAAKEQFQEVRKELEAKLKLPVNRDATPEQVRWWLWSALHKRGARLPLDQAPADLQTPPAAAAPAKSDKEILNDHGDPGN